MGECRKILSSRHGLVRVNYRPKKLQLKPLVHVFDTVAHLVSDKGQASALMGFTYCLCRYCCEGWMMHALRIIRRLHFHLHVIH